MLKNIREWYYYLTTDYLIDDSFWDMLSNIPVPPITCFRVTKGVTKYKCF